MFEYYNANPHNLLIDDCVLRSISVAEGITWRECQEKLSYLANEKAMLLNDVEFVEEYLDERYPRECCNNMTVVEFAKECPKGHYVVTMNGHITAIIDNVIVDTFDCSDRIMWCCWKIM